MITFKVHLVEDDWKLYNQNVLEAQEFASQYEVISCSKLPENLLIVYRELSAENPVSIGRSSGDMEYVVLNKNRMRNK